MKINKRYLTLTIAALAVAAIVLFFPWKYSTGHTCLGDQLLQLNPVPGRMMHSADTMMQRYLIPFGLIWWAGIAALAAVIYKVIKTGK